MEKPANWHYYLEQAIGVNTLFGQLGGLPYMLWQISSLGALLIFGKIIFLFFIVGQPGGVLDLPVHFAS